MNILGNSVTLRAIEPQDLDLLRDMLNDPDMEDKVIGWTFPVSEQMQGIWYEKACFDTNNIRLVIDAGEHGSVGLVTLHDFDWKNRAASVGIKIASTNLRSKGIGTDSVMAIMRYAFDELGLHRLESTAFADNLPSLNLFRKCGWQVEGTKRERAFKNGKFRDLNVIGILENDYRELVENTGYWND